MTVKARTSAAVWVVGIYFVLKMFYVFNTGTAQPADVIMVLMALVTVSPRYLMDFLKKEVALTTMVLWIMLVNGAWFILLGKLQFLTFTSYYIFNVLIAVCVFTSYRQDRRQFEKIIPWFIYASAIMQMGYVILFSGSGRADGTFLNPNQLAYWAVTSITVLLVVRRNRIVLLDLPIILTTLYCAILSVSRAGLIALVFLALIWAWSALATPLKRLLGGLVGALVLIGFMAALLGTDRFDQFSVVEAFEQREASTVNRSMVEERNLDRLVDYYTYTIVGAGEGSYGRFEEGTQMAIEIHSSFATMLFSYGIPGLIFFLAMAGGLFIRVPFTLSVYQLPMLAYGLTHNGLRFSFYWIVTGLLMAIAWEKYDDGATPSATAGKKLKPERVIRDAAYLRALASKR